MLYQHLVTLCMGKHKAKACDQVQNFMLKNLVKVYNLVSVL